MGVALSNDPTTDLGGLLEAADQALYRAKEAGRNCVETSSFAPELVSVQTAGGAVNSETICRVGWTGFTGRSEALFGSGLVPQL